MCWLVSLVCVCVCMLGASMDESESLSRHAQAWRPLAAGAAEESKEDTTASYTSAPWHEARGEAHFFPRSPGVGSRSSNGSGATQLHTPRVPHPSNLPYTAHSRMGYYPEHDNVEVARHTEPEYTQHRDQPYTRSPPYHAGADVPVCSTVGCYWWEPLHRCCLSMETCVRARVRATALLRAIRYRRVL